ncbi:hypothetical protein BLA29_006154, partial [Euroglyphus maynei]
MPFYRNVEGRSSNLIIERTFEDRPTSPPFAITAKVINSTSAIIEWQPPIDPHRNGIILGYYLQIIENNTHLYTNLTLDSTFNSIVLHNLSIGSIFTIQMSAFTAIGNGPLSTPIYLSLDETGNMIDTIDYNSESSSDNHNNHQNEYLSSPIFWTYVVAILMAIILFILAVRLVLFYSNRKNTVKSIYEKADENFSETFAKYDTSNSSSKYSSCPDNNEYAEVNDFKHYGQLQQQPQQHDDDNINAEPYAMTPLIEKSMMANKQQQQSDSSIGESPSWNHHHLTTTDMIHPLKVRQPVLVTHLNGNGKCQTSF